MANIKNLYGNIKNLYGNIKNLYGNIKNLCGNIKNFSNQCSDSASKLGSSKPSLQFLYFFKYIKPLCQTFGHAKAVQKQPQSTQTFETLGEHLGTWAFRQHLEGTQTLRHSDTQDNQTLGHSGSWALGHQTLEALYLVELYMMCLSRCLVTSEGFCVILKTILRVVYPTLCTVYRSMYLCTLKAIASYYTTLLSNIVGLSVNISLHQSFCHEDK